MLKVNNISSVYNHIYDFSTKKANKLKMLILNQLLFKTLFKTIEKFTDLFFKHSISSMKTYLTVYFNSQIGLGFF